ncbi:MAG: hypothetical protein M3P83_12675 [Actinomycetota bacterium]|nr:hypothetical protein [Actinomycetota bacterium]
MTTLDGTGNAMSATNSPTPRAAAADPAPASVSDGSVNSDTPAASTPMNTASSRPSNATTTVG